MRTVDGYLHRGRDPIEKWEKLNLKEFPSIKDDDPVDELIPLYGTDLFDELYYSEKEMFYYEYPKLIAEIILYLEYQFSDFFIRAIKRKKISDETFKAIEHLSEEEAYHTMAYNQYIDTEDPNHKRYIMNNKFFLDITKLIIKISPTCVLIPAAKSEAFSIFYARYLKRHYKEWNANSWCYLNYLHLLDESHHVPFQVDLYNEALQNSHFGSKLKIFGMSLVFFIMMQLIAIYTMWTFVKRCMPERSIFSKIKFTLGLIRWGLFNFEPMQESRMRILAVLNQDNVKYGKVFKVFYS